MDTAPASTSTGRKPIYRHLYFWVLVSIVAGVLVGGCSPSSART
jgi:aerobic C4-dicarboxylate transport protein